MFQTWTRRRTTSTPPDSGPPPAWLCTAALLVALLLPACSGSNKTENRIKPIQANLTIAAFPGTPDPAVFLEGASTTGDLVTVDVKLHTTSLLTFDSLTLEFHFDPTLVQAGIQFAPNPSVLGDCNTGLFCAPLCLNNATDANITGTLLIGISRNPDPSCPPASIGADTTLLTLGFVAATTIDPPGSRIVLFTNPDPLQRGDCEILQYAAGPSPPVDLGILCVDGNATMTASR